MTLLAGVLLLLSVVACDQATGADVRPLAIGDLAMAAPDDAGMSSGRLERLSGAMQKLVEKTIYGHARSIFALLHKGLR